MKSWKARLLMALTMLAMLAMVAVPAMAHDWEAFCVDWDDEGCDEYILCHEDHYYDDEWECIGPFDVDDDWDDDDDDDSSADDSSADDGSGYGGYYWDPLWLG